MLAPIALWAARRHITLLRFGHPEFESWLMDLFWSRPPLSPPVHYIYNYIYILYIYTVGTESIQTPLNFSLFVILQPFAKII